MATTDVLHSLLIPMWEEPLLVPDTAVAEVISFAFPEGEPKQSWHMGDINWRGLILPVICLEGKIPTDSELHRSARIAVLNTPSAESKQPFSAILISGIPRLTNVTEEDVELSPGDGDLPIGIAARVHLGQQHARIPDLPCIEKMSSSVI